MSGRIRMLVPLMIGVVALGLGLFTAPTVNASVASATWCCGEKLTVYKEVVPVDGSSYTSEAVGQVRVSNGSVENTKGNQIGTYSASHTILSINATTGMRKVQNSCTIEFNNGSVMTTGIDYWPIGSAPASGTETTYAIVGGTGAYAGATGTAKQTLMANGFYKTVLTFRNIR